MAPLWCWFGDGLNSEQRTTDPSGSHGHYWRPQWSRAFTPVDATYQIIRPLASLSLSPVFPVLTPIDKLRPVKTVTCQVTVSVAVEVIVHYRLELQSGTDGQHITTSS